MKDFVTAFLFILCALEFVYANEYYISTSGVDGDGCGIQYTPCATLNFTLTLANDGDTIYFLDGEYKNQPNVTINLDNLSFVGQGLSKRRKRQNSPKINSHFLKRQRNIQWHREL